MPKTNSNQIEWSEQFSPKQKFGVFRKNLSLAVGGKKDIGTYANGHPFDVEIIRLPPKKTNWPLHEHSAQWEAYIIISGTGILRTPAGTETIQSGDYIIHPPGEAHQILNESECDLVYYVIADNPQADVIYYPDSKKYFIKPQRKTFDSETEYFKGEE